MLQILSKETKKKEEVENPEINTQAGTATGKKKKNIDSGLTYLERNMKELIWTQN